MAKTSDLDMTRAGRVRDRFDCCRINRLEAIGLLCILGFNAVQADRFLRCLPL